MATQIYNDPRLGEVLLNQTSRARRLSITVLTSGTVRLTYPKTLSNKRALEFLATRADWVIAAKQRVSTRRAANPPASTFNAAELRAKAREYLPKRLAELSQATGLRYNRLAIRATTSKWGSCSSLRNINLSLYLMALPAHLIDFVIIHELCHTVHFNHSAEFHSLVNKFVGGRESELNKELKTYSIR